LNKYNGVGDADAVEMVSTFSFVAVIMLVGIYPAVLTDVINMGIAPIAQLIGM
jgi:NADH:ubiquinone oxidoreductase subunit 4 (subunit M)